jgi:hypothetical protein
MVKKVGERRFKIDANQEYIMKVLILLVKAVKVTLMFLERWVAEPCFSTCWKPCCIARSNHEKQIDPENIHQESKYMGNVPPFNTNIALYFLLCSIHLNHRHRHLYGAQKPFKKAGVDWGNSARTAIIIRRRCVFREDVAQKSCVTQAFLPVILIRGRFPYFAKLGESGEFQKHLILPLTWWVRVIPPGLPTFPWHLRPPPSTTPQKVYWQVYHSPPRNTLGACLNPFYI